MYVYIYIYNICIYMYIHKLQKLLKVYKSR